MVFSTRSNLNTVQKENGENVKINRKGEFCREIALEMYLYGSAGCTGTRDLYVPPATRVFSADLRRERKQQQQRAYFAPEYLWSSDAGVYKEYNNLYVSTKESVGEKKKKEKRSTAIVKCAFIGRSESFASSARDRPHVAPITRTGRTANKYDRACAV